MKKASFLVRWLSFAFLVLAFASRAQGQPSSFFWQRLDKKSGFSKKWTWDLLLDSEGWLWIGSIDGLSRLGGFTLETFAPEPGNPEKLQELLVTGGIFEDAAGDVWIGNNAKIARYRRRDDRFESTTINDNAGKPMNGYIRIVHLNKNNGQVWALVVPDDAPTKLVKMPMKNWPNLRPISQIDLPLLTDRCRFSPDGFLGVAFQRGTFSLSIFDDQQPLFSLDLKHRVFDVFVESRDKVWLATDGGLFEAKAPKWQLKGPFSKSADGEKRLDYYTAIAPVEGKNQFWIAEKDGALHLFDVEKRNFLIAERPDLNNAASLPAESIVNILHDSNGAIWTAYKKSGIAWAVPEKQKFWTEVMGREELVAVFELPNSERGWATKTAIFTQKSNQKAPKKYFLPDGGREIEKAKADANGNIWVSDKYGRLYFFDSNLDRWEVIRRDGAAFDVVFDFDFLPDGRLAVAAFQNAFLIEKHTGRPLSIQPFLDENDLNSYTFVFCDADGRVYLNQNSKELLVFAPDGARGFRQISGPGLINSVQMAFSEDAENVWISTDFGLVGLSKKDQKRLSFGKKTDLPHEPFSTIIDDGAGCLWLGGQNVLFRFNKKNGSTRLFGRPDGLPADEFSNISPVRSRMGTLFFACGKSILTVEPKKASLFTAPPKPQILQILINGERDTILRCERTGAASPQKIEKISLPFSRNSLSFSFTGLDASDRTGGHLEYRLCPTDTAWIGATNPGFVRFSNLHEGQYRFETRIFGSNDVRAIDFSIAPPMQRTPLFIAFMVSLLVGIGFLILRSRRQQRERLEAIRHQIADDLHDDVGGLLSSIGWFSATVRDLVSTGEKSDEEQARQLLERISHNSQRAELAFKTVIWAINPKNDGAGALILRMRVSGSELCDPRDIGFAFESVVSAPAPKLNPQVRHHVFLIFKEALHNAAKYSGTSVVFAVVEINERTLRLEVRDNGGGFDFENAVRSNGLSSMEKRATELRAELKIESKIGEGTSVLLVVDLKKRIPPRAPKG